jgi:hypothetical protein
MNVAKTFDLVLVLLNIILSAILYDVIIKVALIFFRVFPSDTTLFLHGSVILNWQNELSS